MTGPQPPAKQQLTLPLGNRGPHTHTHTHTPLSGSCWGFCLAGLWSRTPEAALRHEVGGSPHLKATSTSTISRTGPHGVQPRRGRREYGVLRMPLSRRRHDWATSPPSPRRAQVDRRQASVRLMAAQGWRKQGLPRTPFPTGGQWRGRQICDRDLPDTADLAQRQWCVAHHSRFRRFARFAFCCCCLSLCCRGWLFRPPEGPPFC